MAEVLLFVEKYHPDTMLANRAVHNNNAMMHFRKMLQCRQKQLTLDKFFVEKARKATAEEKESMRARDRERKKHQNENYPVFLWRKTPLKRYVNR